MSDLHHLGALEAGDAIASGRTTSEALLSACLDRIAERENTVGAWIHLDAEAALSEARARDAGALRGPLHGVPVGVKDIIDTYDMPTGCGSPIYDGNRPAGDAACVSLARAAGLVVMGKTVTTEFALRHPGKTRNPHDPAHTPGGSSSGSAAAVADFMVPLAIGTQTGGSVIRPASYCGVVGYKPSFGTIPRSGVKLLAESLDTIGTMARSVPDAAAFAAVLAGWPAGAVAKPDRAPRLGFCRSPAWSEAEPATVEAMDEAVARARRAGATVVEIDLPRPFGDLMAAQRVITMTETWRSLAYERESHDGLLSDSIKAYVAPGATQDMERYHWALGVQTACRAAMQDVLGGLDSLMTPAAPGEAPEGLTDTGAAVFNQIWTAAGVPSVTVPGLIGPRGLPVGVQLVGPFRSDTRVLSSAAWMHGILGSALRGE